MKFKEMARNFSMAIATTMVTVGAFVQKTAAVSLFDNEGSAASAIANFPSTYQRWFFLGFIAALLAYYLVRDEKMKGYLQKVWIGLLIVFILSIEGVQGALTATLGTIAGA